MTVKEGDKVKVVDYPFDGVHIRDIMLGRVGDVIHVANTDDLWPIKVKFKDNRYPDMEIFDPEELEVV